MLDFPLRWHALGLDSPDGSIASGPRSPPSVVSGCEILSGLILALPKNCSSCCSMLAWSDTGGSSSPYRSPPVEILECSLSERLLYCSYRISPFVYLLILSRPLERTFSSKFSRSFLKFLSVLASSLASIRSAMPAIAPGLAVPPFLISRSAILDAAFSDTSSNFLSARA
jgi:hypothetical protein